MKKLLIIIILLVQGCSNIIDIGGIFINRLNNDTFECDIFISVINTQSKNIPDFRISVLRDNDSLSLTSQRISVTQNPVKIIFPDEQLNPILAETHNLIIIAEHPYIGTFQQLVPVTKLNEAEPIIIEYNIGDVQDSLPKPPLNLYKEYKF